MPLNVWSTMMDLADSCRLRKPNRSSSRTIHCDHEHRWLLRSILLYALALTSGNAHLTFIASYVADYFGRRIGVAIGLIILFVGTIMQAVPTVNDNMFIAGRFLVGLGYVQQAWRCFNTLLTIIGQTFRKVPRHS